MHTVIGAIDDPATAQRAVDQLLQAGFPRNSVHLEHAGSAQAERRLHEADRGFFGRLFGEHDRASAELYDEAVRRGSQVVVVDAPGDAEADQAARLLHALGAYDVEDRAHQWRSGIGAVSGVASGAAAGMPPGQLPGQLAPPGGEEVARKPGVRVLRDSGTAVRDLADRR